MNIYEKLNEARVKFQEKGIKENGKNSYSGYTYFELKDILTAVNQINKELNTTCIVRFDKDIATLDFIDCEKPDSNITFSSPMSTASLKGCHEVQNLGAVESYLKRYLYQHCFEIAESDCLDAGPQKPQDSKPQSRPQAQTVNKTQGASNVPDDVRNVENLTLLLEKFSNSISDSVKEKCNGALDSGDSKAISEMLGRLYKYLDKKGIKL